MLETKSNKIKDIEAFLDETYPNAKCALNYNKDYECLIAVMLSSQTKDSKVNEVTSILFSKYKSLNELNNANLNDIENIIKNLGLYKVKAKNIKEICNILINKYGSKVPSKKEELLKISGVGEKVANVVLIELFEIPEFPVDTHIKRISIRLGLSKNTNPINIEKDLKRTFKKENWISLHHKFIFFGRDKCRAIRPDCINCKLQKYCNYFKKESNIFK